MEHLIYEGDLLIMEKTSKAASNSIVLARFNGEYTLKRLIYESSRPHLKAENPRYEDFIPSKDNEWEICGLLTSVVRLF